MIGYYDYRLVILSVLIAILGSYCTIELAGRVTAAQGWTRASWLIGGAVAMGISTWSMHYTGMLAFRLPIPIEYDWPTAFLSYLASFCTSALGLFVVSRRKMGFVRAFTASIFMGGGVAALHYTAMASMRLRAVCHYSPALVTISVVLAIVFSLMSLWLMFLFIIGKTLWASTCEKLQAQCCLGRPLLSCITPAWLRPVLYPVPSSRICPTRCPFPLSASPVLLWSI